MKARKKERNNEGKKEGLQDFKILFLSLEARKIFLRSRKCQIQTYTMAQTQTKTPPPPPTHTHTHPQACINASMSL